MPPSQGTAANAVAEAAHATGLSPRTVRRYIERGLLDGAEVDLARLARIRRLTGLGVNLAGVEVILRMRAQIIELQEALACERQLRPWPRRAASEGAYRVCGARGGVDSAKQSPSNTGRGEATPHPYPSSAAAPACSR